MTSDMGMNANMRETNEREKTINGTDYALRLSSD